jgi:hypothetical protein
MRGVVIEPAESRINTQPERRWINARRYAVTDEAAHT